MKHWLLHLTMLLFCALTPRATGASPSESLQKMKVTDGFVATIVASEPEIRQPLSVTFDDRGRMWVIQYLQYPTPAGLKPVKVDQFLRTTYDRIPEPPPRGPKGVDKITICEDTDGNGHMDKFKDFVNGLNLCTGMALGHGGVFVLQSPYLLFYPDKNRDDIPDVDPVVLLTGFGMEDAHAFANSLTWGPDGWLYGAQGSTVTANVRGIEFQQGIWRYHPVTHAFELFAEGGGNTWGLDFDGDGEIFAGTNFYEKMLHMRQGAYYIKNFGKHGALHNPHAYGYFDHVPFSGYQGLHISIGGIVYHGGAFGNELEGKYIFANTLDHAVYWANLQPQSSTFTASFGGTLLKTEDELFRPVDCTVGPDGAVYIADWCDKRATHVDPLDTWDRSNGRIYKIEKKAAIAGGKKQPLDLPKLSSNALVDLLSHTNDWFAREARRLLAERRDKKIIPRLRKETFSPGNQLLQVQSFWALYVSGGFDDKTALKALQHTNATIRKWCVRVLGEQKSVSSKLSATLQNTAQTDPDAQVRAQLSCSLRRLPARDGLPVLHELLLRDDASDPHIPLLLWWALERYAIPNRSDVVEIFSDARVWQSPLVRKDILQRLARRYAAEGNAEDLATCVALLDLATNLAKADGIQWRLGSETEYLLKGINEALAGRSLTSSSSATERWFANLPSDARQHLLIVQTGIRLGIIKAHEIAVQKIRDSQVSEGERVMLIETLGETRQPSLLVEFMQILESPASNNLRSAALTALQQIQSADIPTRILGLYSKLTPPLRAKALQLLLARSASCAQLISAVEAGTVSPKDISMDQVRQIASFKNVELAPRIQKIWGKFQVESPAEKQSFINRVKLILKPSGVAGRQPNPNLVEGKKLFQKNCAVCHKLFGEGNTIGPDLAGVDRNDIDLLLSNIVNPSAYIRNEYVSYEIETKDDEVIGGLMVESNATSVTLLDRNNQRHTVARERIKSLNESAVSLMPEGLLETLPPQELIDLIGYLRSK
ncbi:MAG: Dehydrogenase [Verrucomicrobiales bacterium]|nr:Dehydrogenase [Verrucomicrobiales bacterium]